MTDNNEEYENRQKNTVRIAIAIALVPLSFFIASFFLIGG